uniref:ARAD1B23496p n=1 Tax=Blastobotrys adeninivorans TaxID=409370 RepID=A0A060TCF9_BLAAD
MASEEDWDDGSGLGTPESSVDDGEYTSSSGTEEVARLIGEGRKRKKFASDPDVLNVAKKLRAETLDNLDDGSVDLFPYLPSYKNWFNANAVEFLTAVPCVPTELQESFIRGSSCFYRKRNRKDEQNEDNIETDSNEENNTHSDDSDSDSDINDEQTHGTHWTGKEKEQFFALLGRKSRHNLEAIAKEMPTKSLAEIQEYHDLLFKASKMTDKVSMADVPAAIEMSDSWLDFENVQSHVAEEHEFQIAHKSTDQVFRAIPRQFTPLDRSKVKIGDIYDMYFMRPVIQGCRRSDQFDSRFQHEHNYDSSSDPWVQRSDEEEEARPVINVPNLIRISEMIYDATLRYMHPDDMAVGMSKFQFLTGQFIRDFEEYVRDLLRCILRALIKHTSLQADGDDTESDEPSIITLDDVIYVLEMFDLPPGPEGEEFQKMEQDEVKKLKHAESNMHLGPVESMVIEKDASERFLEYCMPGPFAPILSKGWSLDGFKEQRLRQIEQLEILDSLKAPTLSPNEVLPRRKRKPHGRTDDDFIEDDLGWTGETIEQDLDLVDAEVEILEKADLVRARADELALTRFFANADGLKLNNNHDSLAILNFRRSIQGMFLLEEPSEQKPVPKVSIGSMSKKAIQRRLHTFHDSGYRPY